MSKNKKGLVLCDHGVFHIDDINEVVNVYGDDLVVSIKDQLDNIKTFPSLIFTLGGYELLSGSSRSMECRLKCHVVVDNEEHLTYTYDELKSIMKENNDKDQ